MRTDRVDALTFVLGTGLAGLAGAALCLLGPVGPFIGTDYIVQAFLVVVLGGVGQLIGTVAAAARSPCAAAPRRSTAPPSAGSWLSEPEFVVAWRAGYPWVWTALAHRAARRAPGGVP